VPLLIPGHKNSSPVCVDGAMPGIRVVTALMIVEEEGPKDNAQPQLSRRERLALAVVARVAIMSVEIISTKW
jgi:hypothetical protein